LSIVPSGQEFHFFLAEGVNTNVSAKNLEEFANKLDGVKAQSVLFHYPRGDFQKWIKEVVGDNVLADRMCFIQRDLPGEDLRNEVLKILYTRIKELKAPDEEKSVGKSMTGEPKHTEGHSIEIIVGKVGEFMCPECGKTFKVKDEAEKHLHTVHLKHLRTEHKEFHGDDSEGQHLTQTEPKSNTLR